MPTVYSSIGLVKKIENSSKCGMLRELLCYGHKMNDKPLLVRLDSGNDSADNYCILLEDSCFLPEN